VSNSCGKSNLNTSIIGSEAAKTTKAKTEKETKLSEAYEKT
jgi:hypothetical protein